MPANSAYNIPTSLRIQGKLDVHALGRALNEVVCRHEILRTRFVEAEGEPVQVIEPDMQVVIEQEDLTGVSATDQERLLEDRLREEGRCGFDLTRLPLLRARLFQLGNDEQVFLLVLHHIIVDGWSLPILFQELETLYEGYGCGEEPSLPDLPVQYADYAVWQRQQFERGGLQADLDYWKEQLRGAPEVLELPADYPRSDNPNFNGGGEYFDLSPAVVDGLKRLSRRGAASFYMTMLAAYAVLLHRYSGQDEVLIGIPAANREYEELQGLIGFFVNMLVMRINLQGNPSFIELLQRVRQTALDAYEHQKLPFELLVDELKPERNLKVNPLFQVAFSLVTERVDGGPRPGVWPRFKELNNFTAKFDTGAIVLQTSSRCSINLGYNLELFRQETFVRVKKHFQKLLEEIVELPEAGVSTIPILLPEEQRVMRDWQQTRAEYPRAERIEQIFLSQVERTPHSPALLYPFMTLTYQELDSAANRVAQYLRRLGAGTETIIGVCMERSWQMVVALLGVLKAGGAYLPLDPGYPQTRLEFMLEDTGASVVLTQGSLRASFRESSPGGCQFVCYEDIPETEGVSPILHGNPENLAYIIYTSGSTGTPKGIGIPHHGVTRLVCNTNYVDLGPGDRIAQASNSSFDAATFEIWGALLTGGCVVGLTREESLNPKLLAARIRNDGITTMFLTTALFNQFAASEDANAFGDLKYLLFGGEAVDPRWVREVLKYSAPGCLLHVYGPTENTTFSTWHAIKFVPPRGATIPIGVPISNTETYVLDKNLTPVPTGVIGELYLGGDGLARGYVNRPELTAEKFIPNPFSLRGSERLYRTGDLVRYQAGGAIEFVGRIDQQVKIRGFRIEPGEIESVLRQHPTVRESIVLVEENQGEKRLVAYAVAEEGVDKEELRQSLKERLPAYMIPARLVMVSELPLTENGKVDRLKLLEYAATVEDEAQENGYVEPRNELERTIASIWREMLGAERVGVYDNIFDLGGHSLLLMQVHARMRKRLPEHTSVKVTDLFLYPTIDSLVEFMGQRAMQRL